MEEDRESIRYWCHQCTRPVFPILGIETVKCSSCNGEFVEEMSSVTADHDHQEIGSDSDRDRALSLWAPILLGMMNNPRRARRFRHIEFDNDDEEGERHDPYERHRRFQFQNPRDEREREREGIDDVVRRRRRGPTVTLQLSGDGDRERVIMINPFNQTIVVQGGGGGGNGSQTHPIGSLGDYFTGHGLEQLLQHLAENDPNRYGTPPAKKEAVEAIPTVTVNEKSVQCSVCLDDFEVGNEVKEMPCKHMFHDKCIIPWLELHSTCPVCRYELPSDETKLNQEREGNTEDGDEGNLSRFSVSLPWPFSSLFSSGHESGSSVTSTSATGGSSSTPPHGEEDRN